MALVLALALVIATGAILYQRNQAPNVCGETETVQADELVGPYTPENSGLKSKIIRTLTMGPNGLWVGYAGGVGLSYFDGESWRFCGQMPHVNAIVLDAQGHPWVGTDAPPGGPALLHYDGTIWTDYTKSLPDYRVYDLYYFNNNLLVATWEGVAQYDGRGGWTVPYNTTKNIFDNHIDAIAFTQRGDIWFGSIGRGLTWYSNALVPSPWVLVDSPALNQTNAHHELGGDSVRKITVAPSGKQVWIASDGGDLTVYDYATNTWTRLPVPNNHVIDLKFDHYNRPWIVTAGGTFYLENGGIWVPVFDYPALALAFGYEGGKFSQNVVFIGTDGFGLVQTNVPQPVKPGGMWVSPNDGAVVNGPVQFDVRAYPAQGGPKIQYVQITLSWDGRNGPWIPVCSFRNPSYEDHFVCEKDLTTLGEQVPKRKQLNISFDVTDMANKTNEAPNGIHHITWLSR